jgi:predicted exporter
MIALVAGKETLRSGPVPIALTYAGLDARAVLTTEDADEQIDRHGTRACVLVIDAESLDATTAGDAWTAFLAKHPALPAVVISHGPAQSHAKAMTLDPHRMLVEDPFDAAAVVNATRRASAMFPLVVRRRVPFTWSDAG